jgi:hypothetical protein
LKAQVAKKGTHPLRGELADIKTISKTRLRIEFLVFFTPKALKGVRSPRTPNLRLSPQRVGKKPIYVTNGESSSPRILPFQLAKKQFPTKYPMKLVV